jgi:hypothetical protein
MRFSSALLLVLSASFAVAVPVRSGTESAAEWFDKAYTEKRSPEEAAEWFDKAYTEKRSPEEDTAAAEWFDKAYESN